jgi:phosphohistidine phosphatase
MKTILLMRHAKSSWKNPHLADHDRPLNKRGERDAPLMGEWLNQKDIIPDLILSSTALRTKMTVEGLLKTCGFEGEVKYLRSLYHGGPEDYFEALINLPEEIQYPMIVSHNPGMEYFIDLICDVQERMPTAAIAEINLPIDNWLEINDEVDGQLMNLWRPREIP